MELGWGLLRRKKTSAFRKGLQVENQEEEFAPIRFLKHNTNAFDFERNAEVGCVKDSMRRIGTN